MSGPDTAAGTPGGDGVTVLIIEDQEAIVEVLSDALGDAGFVPLAAPSAGVAAAYAQESSPAVILLDVMMPELSGWTVLDQLRAEPSTREIPVVITSAVYDRPGLHSLPPGGPVRFVPKPFDVAALIAAVADLAQE